MRTVTSLIDGKPASPASETHRTIKSPFDGRPVTEAAFGTPDLLETALAAATRMRPRVAALPARERAEILERLSHLVIESREELALMLSEEAGKPITLARGEADRCAETIADAAACARRPASEWLPFDGTAAGVHRHGVLRRFPIGVVAAITPFNFPLNLVAHKIAPAIAAGCPVVLKPASQTPSTAVRLAALAHEAGWPAGALNVVLISGAEADALVTDDRPALITFTGSMAVGWEIKSRCRRKKVALELGGNAAAIVEPDADWKQAAARLATCAFAYAGQSCISVQRIFVHAAIADEFTDALTSAAEATPAGDPACETTVCGPLIDAANADRVLRWIADAGRQGGRILCGAERQGNVIRPTIVRDAPRKSELNCNEVFGPVVTVATYTDFDDALSRVNEGSYGLQAGIYTNDWRKIWKAYETLEVGTVVHNDAPTFRIDAMPYGGVKQSGLGREGARWAIEEMTEPRLLLLSTKE